MVSAGFVFPFRLAGAPAETSDDSEAIPTEFNLLDPSARITNHCSIRRQAGEGHWVSSACRRTQLVAVHELLNKKVLGAKEIWQCVASNILLFHAVAVPCLTCRSGNGGTSALIVGTREVTSEMHLPSAKQVLVSSEHSQLVLHLSPSIARHTCSMEAARGITPALDLCYSARADTRRCLCPGRRAKHARPTTQDTQAAGPYRHLAGIVGGAVRLVCGDGGDVDCMAGAGDSNM